jgi:membrane protein
VADEPERGVIAMGRELVKEFTEDDVPGLAAEVAYHAIFSIPALLVVLVTLGAVINNVFDYGLADRLTTVIEENAPESTQTILKDLVTNAVDRVDGGAASIGLATSILVALWAGSNGVGALIKAFNRAYDAAELRAFHKKKGMAVLLTVMLGLVINFAFAIWVFGGQIGGWIAGEFRMGERFDWVWNLSRIPVGALVIVLMLGLLYYYGPTMEQAFRWVLPGATFSTLVWGLLVLGFSLYMRFANPGSAYGALSGMIVFLFFLYLTALIFIAGAELNAVLARRHDARYREAIARFPADAPADRSVAGRLSPAATAQPASLGVMAVGAATVVGVVIAAALRSRGS